MDFGEWHHVTVKIPYCLCPCDRTFVNVTRPVLISSVFGLILIIIDIVLVIVDLSLSNKSSDVESALEAVSLAISFFFLIDVLLRVYVEGFVVFKVYNGGQFGGGGRH